MSGNKEEENNEKKPRIDVTVDTSTTERLARENQRLQQELKDVTDEKEDLKDKLGLIAEKELARKRKELGLPEDDKRGIDELMAYAEGLKASKGTQKASGQAPLSPAQGYSPQLNPEGTPLEKMKFGSYEEMVSYLRSLKTEQSEKYLTRILAKGVDEWKKAGRPELSYGNQDENKPKSTEQPTLDLASMGLTTEDESELKRWGIKKNPNMYSKTHTQSGQPKKEGEKQ
jgi:hypothetical protein